MQTSPTDTPRREVIEPVVRGLYRVVALHRDVQRRTLPRGALGRLATMGVLYRRGPVRVSDVAEDLHVDGSVASRQVNALEAEGHVRREPDHDDGRSQLVHLTDDGRAALLEGWYLMVEAVAGAVEGWSDEEVAALGAALTRLSEDYATTVARPAPAGAAA